MLLNSCHVQVEVQSQGVGQMASLWPMRPSGLGAALPADIPTVCTWILGSWDSPVVLVLEAHHCPPASPSPDSRVCPFPSPGRKAPPTQSCRALLGHGPFWPLLASHHTSPLPASSWFNSLLCSSFTMMHPYFPSDLMTLSALSPPALAPWLLPITMK